VTSVAERMSLAERAPLARSDPPPADRTIV